MGKSHSSVIFSSFILFHTLILHLDFTKAKHQIDFIVANFAKTCCINRFRCINIHSKIDIQYCVTKIAALTILLY